ncbi:MAG: M20/M25/M40 family metallo-hydrolase [Bacteroidota bacterium]|nr:M20/M25/M40 family metallo-hydrolase [Bacteroidota bacterium]
MDPVELAVSLIDIPSISGDERRLAEFLEHFCLQRGWEVERQYVEEGRWNLFVNWHGNVPVAFCTHIDTVPPFTPPRVEDGFLYGRGACDTKGIIGAMIAAGERLMQNGQPPAYLFVVGEETNSIGAKTAAVSGRTASFLIVGEPTENTPARAHKGVLSYRLETEGIAAHSGYPERGKSAIHVLLEILHDILTTDWGTDPILGQATVNVGEIHGGTAANVFAVSARACVVHRIVDSVQERKRRLVDIVGDRARIIIQAENDPQHLFVPEGYPSVVVSYGTDIPYLRGMATPLLVGPGSIHDAHTADERIEIAQIHAAVELYTDLFTRLSSLT